ncbi:hypothetical protein ES702_02964 [subsurface metagenome]
MVLDLDIEKISKDWSKEILENKDFIKEIEKIIREKLKALLKES